MISREEEGHFRDDEDIIGAEGWLFSYADLMTLLFGFFVMLFAFSMENQGQIEQKLKDINPTGFGNKIAIERMDFKRNPVFVEMERRLQQLNDKMLLLQKDLDRVSAEKKVAEDNVQSLTQALNELQFGKGQSFQKKPEVGKAENSIDGPGAGTGTGSAEEPLVGKAALEEQKRIIAMSEEKLKQISQNLALVVAEKIKVTTEKKNAELQIESLKKSLDELAKEKTAALNESQRKGIEIATLSQNLQKLETEKVQLISESKQKDEAVTKYKGDFLTMQAERERSRSEKKLLDARFEKVREENEKMSNQVKRLEGIREELERSVVIHELQKKQPEKSQKSPASVPGN